MRATLLLLVASLLPSLCFAGLGLGGIAPQAAEPAALPNINVPTDLCQKEFCLAGVPAACGGCLANKAAGTYIGDKLKKISTICNAGKIAAARRKATLANYNKLFPCTAKVNSTVVIGLDSCLTGTNATATNCPEACSASLLDVPPTCRATFPELSKPWVSTLKSCIAGDATAPNAEAANAEGVLGGTPATPGLALAPVSGDTAQAVSSAGMAVASFGTVLLASVVAALAIYA